MAGSLYARFRKGLAGQAFSQAVVFGTQIASVPLFVHFWGLQLYGEWLVLFALPSWLMLTDLGFTAATGHEMTMRTAAGDTDGALSAFQTTWLVLCVASLLASIAAVAAVAYLPFAGTFGFVELDGQSTVLVLALLLLQMLVTLQANLLVAGLVCVGAYGEGSALDAVTRLGAFALMIGAVAGGFGPVGAAAGLAIGTFLGFIALRLWVRHRTPWLTYGTGKASTATGRRLLLPSLGFTGFVVGNALAIQGPILVIGATIGPAATVVYTTLRMMTRAVIAVSTLLFANVRPEIAIAHGAGDEALVRRLHGRSVQAGVWLIALAATVLIVAGDPVVRLWTTGKVAVEQPLFALLIVAMAGSIIGLASGTVLYATNRSQQISPVLVVVAALALAAAIPLADIAGLAGVAATAAVSEWLLAGWVVHRTLPAIEERPLPLVLRAFTPPFDLWRIVLRR